MMAAATTVVAERSAGPGSARKAGADYSVLVVVGALRSAGLLEQLLQQIDTGELLRS